MLGDEVLPESCTRPSAQEASGVELERRRGWSVTLRDGVITRVEAFLEPARSPRSRRA